MAGTANTLKGIMTDEESGTETSAFSFFLFILDGEGVVGTHLENMFPITRIKNVQSKNLFQRDLGITSWHTNNKLRDNGFICCIKLHIFKEHFFQNIELILDVKSIGHAIASSFFILNKINSKD